jgi:hypothetical protein
MGIEPISGIKNILKVIFSLLEKLQHSTRNLRGEKDV